MEAARGHDDLVIAAALAVLAADLAAPLAIAVEPPAPCGDIAKVCLVPLGEAQSESLVGESRRAVFDDGGRHPPRLPVVSHIDLWDRFVEAPIHPAVPSAGR